MIRNKDVQAILELIKRHYEGKEKKYLVACIREAYFRGEVDGMNKSKKILYKKYESQSN